LGFPRRFRPRGRPPFGSSVNVAPRPGVHRPDGSAWGPWGTLPGGGGNVRRPARRRRCGGPGTFPASGPVTGFGRPSECCSRGGGGRFGGEPDGGWAGVFFFIFYTRQNILPATRGPGTELRARRWDATVPPSDRCQFTRLGGPAGTGAMNPPQAGNAVLRAFGRLSNRRPRHGGTCPFAVWQGMG